MRKKRELENPFEEVSGRQAVFYNYLYEKGSCERFNLAMRTWFALKKRLKYHMKEKGPTLNARIKELHRKWAGSETRHRVLDLGCGQGSGVSRWMLENSNAYTGVDLSEKALEKYSKTVPEDLRSRVTLCQGDFFDMDFPKESFDMIYASAVLHHFPNFDRLCRELNRILEPGGVVLSVDPLSTGWIARIIRPIYRRFQENRDWEWPFQRDNFHVMQRYFSIEKAAGFFGPVSIMGFLLSLVPGLSRISDLVYRIGVRADGECLDMRSPAFWQRNIVVLMLRKKA